MVYVPTRASPDELQADVDAAFARVVKSGFLKPVRGRARPTTCTQEYGHEKRPVVVETRGPRMKPDELAAAKARRKAVEEADKAREAEEAEKARKAEEAKREAQAQLAVRNAEAPVSTRIEAARLLGYLLTPRGPDDQPHKVIARHPNTGERIVFYYPKGKNARGKVK